MPRSDQRTKHRNPNSLANLERNKFKPGQSGNPGGRPKSKHISEALRELLKNGDADAIAEKLVVLAKAGDVQAIKEAADRTEGKAPQTVNVNADISISSRRDRVRDLISGITGKTLG